MADWATISSLATAGGTLVLAVATFASVRSANHAARVAEQAMLAGLRPLLTPSRLDDPTLRVGFVDGHWMKIDGGHAAADLGDGAIYLAFTVRNSGAGVAVLHSWAYYDRYEPTDIGEVTAEQFTRLTRDLYIPAGEVGFWQGAVRDPDDPVFAALSAKIEQRQPFMIDVLYGDDEGGQRMISRFTVEPKEGDGWITISTRHRNLDRSDPRGQ